MRGEPGDVDWRIADNRSRCGLLFLLHLRPSRWKLDLIAHPVEKTDLDFALRRQLNGMEVQQVGLDGERVCAKRWPIAYVGNGVEAFIAYARPCDVNAIFGNKLLVASQVDGRYGIFRAIAASASGRPQNTERARQQMPRPAHAPLTD